jgi:type I restriction enzyme S subunit
MSTKPIAELGVTHFKGISVKDKGVEGKYTLVPSGAVFPDVIKLDRCKKFTGDMAKVSQKFLQPNDVLFNSGGVGTLGRSHHIDDIQPRSFVPDSFVMVLRSSGVQVLSKYLYYYLQTPSAKQLIAENTRGTIGITSIKSEAVLGFKMPCPSITEQQRIVHLLDEAFEGIAIAKANAEKNLQNTRTLFESHLHSIYSEGNAVWPAVPLGEICDVLDNLRKPVTKRDRVVGPYPYYGATGVVDHVANFLFDEPLVLVGEDGAKWGPGEKSAFLVSGKVWVNNHAHVVRPHRQRVLDQWLVFYLTHIDLNEYVSGLTVPKLNQGSMREIPIPLPKIAEQQLIVDTLKELEASVNQLAESYAAKLRACEELSSSLLDQAFSGDLKAA